MTKEMHNITINRANRRDLDQIFDLVNLAFKMEIGKTGLAYRKCDKYRLKDQTRKHLDEMLVARENRKIVGCVRSVSHNGVTEIGPLAVLPDYQGQGIGAALMEAIENKGRNDKFTVGIVSCRTDVVPFFLKRGYKLMVTKSVEEMGKLYPDDLGEKVITRTDIEFVILMKQNDG